MEAIGEAAVIWTDGVTATDGAARWKTGAIEGTANGDADADIDGDRDNDGVNDNELRVVPETGIPVSEEALELAPAALDIPDAGTEI